MQFFLRLYISADFSFGYSCCRCFDRCLIKKAKSFQALLECGQHGVSKGYLILLFCYYRFFCSTLGSYDDPVLLQRWPGWPLLHQTALLINVDILQFLVPSREFQSFLVIFCCLRCGPLWVHRNATWCVCFRPYFSQASGNRYENVSPILRLWNAEVSYRLFGYAPN